jgi:hypothetical protein
MPEENPAGLALRRGTCRIYHDDENHAISTYIGARVVGDRDIIKDRQFDSVSRKTPMN